MLFPYGLSDFATLRQEGYFYQDRTDRIPQLEAAGRQLLFIRPRRFGKSLLLSMLEHYYDLNRAKDFEALFGPLAIGRNPTPLHNRYFVMKWDFSLIQSRGGVQEIEAAIHRHLNDCMRDFAYRYQAELPQAIDLHPEDALTSWRTTLRALSATPYKLYLLIDEYDNFANEVLMAGRKQDHYEALLYGEGLLKTVFKAVKAAAGGLGLDRVFITGVSPVVMSDITSGYNVAENLYLNPDFNSLCGFTEAEITAMLARMTDEGASWSAAEALETMRTAYNGYCFSPKSQERIYNPTLSLYFLKHLQHSSEYPEPLLDENLAMDRNKLIYIAQLPHGEELLIQALADEQGVPIPQLATRFGVADMLSAVKDQPFMASLLYYFGVLTLGGQGKLGKTLLRIPNLVARGLYIERLHERWLTTYEDRETSRTLAEEVYLQGDLTAMVAFIESRYYPVLSNRDYRWTNELAVKLAFLTLLFDDRLYLPLSEAEVDHGYVDLALILRPDMRRFQALDLVLEFKYVSLKALGLTGEQVREQTPEALARAAPVAEALAAASEQARRYGKALRKRFGLNEICEFAVVGIGLERVIWQRLDAEASASA
ncbi:AAA family ATPase [Lamprobacter modestohalophilus]|uniref:AAA family ATPase n=1 Tax=Lamprobacter modestohalophilus TaxID=1064514 RepID=UPI002ADED48A|nr:AAA family ATPase [Lamprobacter modestohalophilus]MEA1048687.1 AAA family ATPase [Lamprobacter modestohalophilus]